MITIRRRVLPKEATPKWSQLTNGLIPIHLTNAYKIEDVDNSLQVDFANKYIVSKDDCSRSIDVCLI